MKIRDNLVNSVTPQRGVGSDEGSQRGSRVIEESVQTRGHNVDEGLQRGFDEK